MWCIQPIKCVQNILFLSFIFKVIFIPQTGFSQRFYLFRYFLLWDAANESNCCIPGGTAACCKTWGNNPFIQYKRVSRYVHSLLLPEIFVGFGSASYFCFCPSCLCNYREMSVKTGQLGSSHSTVFFLVPPNLQKIETAFHPQFTNAVVGQKGPLSSVRGWNREEMQKLQKERKSTGI